MDTLTAIHTRFSVSEVSPEPVPRRLIEQLLSAAVQAPNHYRVRPWRFVVLTGDARQRLGDVMAVSFQRRFPDAGPKALDKERGKPLRSPVLVAVAVDPPGEDPRVIELENVCAAAAACQNLLLAVHELGLAAKWRTGDAVHDPLVKEFLGFDPAQQVIAFLYIGYLEHAPGSYERPGYEERTVWME
jgi:nitroreductase